MLDFIHYLGSFGHSSAVMETQSNGELANSSNIEALASVQCSSTSGLDLVGEP